MSALGRLRGALGAWRKVASCVGVFAAIWLVSYLLLLEPMVDGISQREMALMKLKDDYIAKKKQAINLDLYRQQVRELEQSHGSLLRMLPPRLDSQFLDIMQSARGNGLRIDYLQPDAAEIVTDSYFAMLKGQLKVTGPFHDVGHFVHDLSISRGIVALYSPKLEASQTSGLVSLEAQVGAYRYLDEAEIAAQRKAAAKKGPSKK